MKIILLSILSILFGLGFSGCYPTGECVSSVNYNDWLVTETTSESSYGIYHTFIIFNIIYTIYMYHLYHI